MSYITIYFTISILLIIVIVSYKRIIINNNFLDYKDKLTFDKFYNEKTNNDNTGNFIENMVFNSIIMLMFHVVYNEYMRFTSKLIIINKLALFNENYLILLMLVSLWTILMVINPYNLKESSIIMCLSLMGLILMINSKNLIAFYLGLELYSLSTYVLASGCEFINFNLNKKNISSNNVNLVQNSNIDLEKSSVASSLKYFILSAISSSIFILGIILKKNIML